MGSLHHKMKMRPIKISEAFRNYYVYLSWPSGRVSTFDQGGVRVQSQTKTFYSNLKKYWYVMETCNTLRTSTFSQPSPIGT